MISPVIDGVIIGAVIAWTIPQIMKRLFGTRYRTVKECEGCEKRSEDEAAQENLRRELSAVKKLLLIIAENQGIKPTQLEGLMK